MGPDALKLLELLPLAAVGALLSLAGLHLALSRRLMQTGGWSLGVILLTALVAVLFNVALAFLVGLAAEFLRIRLQPKQASAKDHSGA